MICQLCSFSCFSTGFVIHNFKFSHVRLGEFLIELHEMMSLDENWQENRISPQVLVKMFLSHFMQKTIVGVDYNITIRL
jgi:hypothetical protein